MRELNVMEINEVSGAGWWSSITSGILLSTIGAAAGAAFGGVHGADGGGILGVGIISQGIGLIAGTAIGLVAGAITGMVMGYDSPETVTGIANQWMNNFSNGVFP